jgi:hypothetical protein
LKWINMSVSDIYTQYKVTYTRFAGEPRVV